MFRWFTTKAVFFVLALTVYGANLLPQQRCAAASENPVLLRFGHSIALSDFDSDGLIDQARVEGSGPRKSIEVVLSQSGKLLVLHFDTFEGSHGSLFADDVNNDGATDLIWTDLLHADDVVVWLGDGDGRFERTSPTAFRDEFTLNDVNVVAPAESAHDPAINFGISRPIDYAQLQRFLDWSAPRLPNELSDRLPTLAVALESQTVRGPPLLLN
ncbi:MAG TPA: VCBS repeat-containing protein [Blastocatellia bacterium]|nr:VCBS repeat-containing protein [Blastocatellia bacterium]